MLTITDGISKCLGWALGAWEIAAILVLVLLLFGGKKLPELARGLARGLKIFKSEMRDIKNHVENSTDNGDESSSESTESSESSEKDTDEKNP